MVFPILPVVAVAGVSALGGALGGLLGGGGGGDTLAEGAKKGSTETYTTVNVPIETTTTTDSRVFHAPYEYFAPSYQDTQNYSYTYAPYIVTVENSPYASIEASKKDSLINSSSPTQSPTQNPSNTYSPSTSAEVTPTVSTTARTEGGMTTGTDMTKLLLIGGAILLLGGGAYYVLRK